MQVDLCAGIQNLRAGSELPVENKKKKAKYWFLNVMDEKKNNEAIVKTKRKENN